MTFSNWKKSRIGLLVLILTTPLCYVSPGAPDTHFNTHGPNANYYKQYMWVVFQSSPFMRSIVLTMLFWFYVFKKIKNKYRITLNNNNNKLNSC